MKIKDIDMKAFADHAFGGRKLAATIALAGYIAKVAPKPSVPTVEDGDDDDLLDNLMYGYVSAHWIEIALKLCPIKTKS